MTHHRYSPLVKALPFLLLNLILLLGYLTLIRKSSYIFFSHLFRDSLRYTFHSFQGKLHASFVTSFPTVRPLLCAIPPVVKKAAEEAAPQTTGINWWYVGGVTVGIGAGIVLFFATGGLAAAAAGTTVTAMSAGTAAASVGNGLVVITAPISVGGTIVAVLTSTTPTALMLKISLLTGGLALYYCPNTREVVDATTLHQYLMESGMPEWTHSCILSKLGIPNIKNIPHNYPVSINVDPSWRIVVYSYKVNGSWKEVVEMNMNYTQDIYRCLEWVSLRIAQKTPPADLLPPPSILRYLP